MSRKAYNIIRLRSRVLTSVFLLPQGGVAMAEKQVFLTSEGLAKLEAELEHLRTARRSEVAEKIHRAKELGTVNNAEYDDAKNEQAFVEGRILTLEKMLRNAAIIPSTAVPSGWVRVGSRVTVRNQEGGLETYTIVGSAEADPSQGLISNESPVGRTLLGKKVGEEVQVRAPAGVLRMTVVEIG